VELRGIGSRRLFDLGCLEGVCFWGEGERDWRFEYSARIEGIDSERGKTFGRGYLRGVALMGEKEGRVRLVRDAGRIIPDDGRLVWIGEGIEICGGVGSS
jgi:hypothetical protein